MILFKRYLPILTLLTALLTLAAACAPTEGVQKKSERDLVELEDAKDADITLADHLSKVSGVNVFGSGNNVRVKIRGATSFNATTAPLFVVNGQKLGRSYSRVANVVPVSDIKSIKVVRGADAAIYGSEGANGVIEITTKK